MGENMKEETIVEVLKFIRYKCGTSRCGAECPCDKWLCVGEMCHLPDVAIKNIANKLTRGVNDEDCKVGMKVKVVKNPRDQDNILEAKAIISDIDRGWNQARLSFLSDIRKYWLDDMGCKSWYVTTDCIEPIKNETKLSTKYIQRLLSSKYVDEKLRELALEYNIPYTPITMDISEDGRIDICFENYRATAKCHPDDKFDVNKGLELAFKRLAEKLNMTLRWRPKNGEKYYLIGVTAIKSGECVIRHIDMIDDYYYDELNVILGNCFKTKEEAERNKEKMVERYKKILDYARSLK